jgi:acetate CoA/acetoacetate CoA-transferase beta subunit
VSVEPRIIPTRRRNNQWVANETLEDIALVQRGEQLQARERIAQRVAQELKDGDVVNLGIGLPTLIPTFLPPDVRLVLQSENGFVGLDSLEGEAEPGAVDAGGRPYGLQPGAAMFDSAMSFCLIRGGHVAVTVLQVDQQGNLANWMVPGRMVPGTGGA